MLLTLKTSFHHSHRNVYCLSATAANIIRPKEINLLKFICKVSGKPIVQLIYKMPVADLTLSI